MGSGTAEMGAGAEVLGATRGAARARLTRRDQTAGKARWKVAPWPGFEVAHSRPPWLSPIDRLIESPIPSPPGFVV